MISVHYNLLIQGGKSSWLPMCFPAFMKWSKKADVRSDHVHIYHTETLKKLWAGMFLAE